MLARRDVIHKTENSAELFNSYEKESVKIIISDRIHFFSRGIETKDGEIIDRYVKCARKKDVEEAPADSGRRKGQTCVTSSHVISLKALIWIKRSSSPREDGILRETVSPARLKLMARTWHVPARERRN